jgi:hypothetical protein
MRRSAFVALLAIIAVLAACSDQSASASAEASVSAEATATATATEEATQSEAASEAALPSFDLNGDPELAARFPDTVGGQALQVISMRGDNPMMSGASDPAFEEFLDSIGAEMSDVSVAFGGTASGESSFGVAAFRVLGANQDQLESQFIAASEQSGEFSAWSQSSLAGKDVWTATDTTGATPGAILYAKDDTIYFMTGDEALATEVLNALP